MKFIELNELRLGCHASMSDTVRSVPHNMALQEASITKNTSFLKIPCEIRLKIYHLVFLSSPIQRPSLPPWHPFPTVRKHQVQRLLPPLDDDDHTTTTKNNHPAERRLLPAERPYHRIPTALLQTSRQIYHEARTLPFTETEHVFAHWFSAGLASATAFTRARQPWQRAAMRFVRLEVFARDLAEDGDGGGGGARLADWIWLCDACWAEGLQGLRLRVFVEGGAAYRAWEAVVSNGKEEEDRCARELVVEGNERWIVEGLGRLKGLRQLEVELVSTVWSSVDKLQWCARLQKVLSSCSDVGSKHGPGELKQVEVVCVEKVTNHGPASPSPDSQVPVHVAG